jgi:hypothetical protein
MNHRIETNTSETFFYYYYFLDILKETSRGEFRDKIGSNNKVHFWEAINIVIVP